MSKTRLQTINHQNNLALWSEQIADCRSSGQTESVDMAVQPVLRSHVIAGFRIDVIAAQKHSDKQIGGALFAGGRVKHRNLPPSPLESHRQVYAGSA